MSMENAYANTIGLNSVYNRSASSPARASTESAGSTPGEPTGDPAMASVANAVNVGKRGNVLVTFFVFLAMTVGLMFLAQHVGNKGGEYKGIRPTVTNVVVMGWVAILGIIFWKVVFTRVKVPGVSALVHMV